jgi:lauroyl/myristoyl acyltransferase/lipid-A-disaccharide synthase-like uncharacterized protein
VQWIASERAGRSVVPVAFWFLSLSGSVLLLAYAWLRHDAVFIAAQSIALLVYIRNLQLLWNRRDTGDDTSERAKGAPVTAVVLTAAMVVTTLVAAASARHLDNAVPGPLLVLGLAGQFVFGTRFGIQLLASEKEGRSVMPLGFWYSSLAGSALLLTYALFRKDPVFILAHAPNLAVYTRNLVLIRRERAAAASSNAGKGDTGANIPYPRRAAYWLGYALFRTVLQPVMLMPRRWRLRTGDLLGLGAYALSIRKNVVSKNVAFTGITQSRRETKRLMRRIYRTVGRSMVDAAAFSPGTQPKVVIENEELLQKKPDDKRGVLLVGAHFGNWELLIHVLSRHFRVLGIVAKPMRNPWIDRWITRQRAEPGVELIHPHNAMRRSIRLLQHGNAVAYLIDQYPGRRGAATRFLGRSARTVRSAAGIAAITGCRVVTGYATVDGNGTYRVSLTPIPPIDVDREKRSEAINQALQQHNDIVTEWILEHPEQWFGWFHRRFKDSIAY